MTKPDKELGLILHVAYADGTRRYYDWQDLADERGAIVHHGDRSCADGTITVERTSRFSASGAEERPEVDARGVVSMNPGPCVFKDFEPDDF